MDLNKGLFTWTSISIKSLRRGKIDSQKSGPLVATNHEHLVIACSSGILLLLWGYAEIVPPPLLWYPPVSTH